MDKDNIILMNEIKAGKDLSSHSPDTENDSFHNAYLKGIVDIDRCLPHNGKPKIIFASSLLSNNKKTGKALNELYNKSKKYDFISLSRFSEFTYESSERMLRFPSIIMPAFIADSKTQVMEIDFVNSEILQFIHSKRYLQDCIENIAGKYKYQWNYAAIKMYYLYQYYLYLLKKAEPDKVVLWCKFNIYNQLLDCMCKEMSIEVHYIEYGVLPGSLVLESDGQMGESFPATNYNEFLALNCSESDIERSRKRLYALRDDKRSRHEKRSKSDVSKIRRDIDSNQPTIMFAGQFDYDAGLVPYTEHSKEYHSPLFKSSDDAAIFLAEICKKNGWNLLYKPHPLMISYDLLADEYPANLVLVNSDYDIYDIIEVSDVVVTLFSQTAYLSLINQKATMMLGYNQLKHKNCAYEAYELDDIEKELNRAIQFGFTNEMAKNFEIHVAQLEKHYLFDDANSKEMQYYSGIAQMAQKLSGDRVKQILMMPHQGYHAETMWSIAQELWRNGIETLFLRPVEKYWDMGVVEAAHKLQIELLEIDQFVSGKIMPDAVLVVNDWDSASEFLLDHCRENSIPIIGLQEGTCDFDRVNWANSFYSNPQKRPYSSCDFLLLASDFDAGYFPSIPHSVTGLSRVETLLQRQVSPKENRLVLINLNFGFGVCEEYARQWLLDVTWACRESDLDYTITRHPQDNTNINGFENKVSSQPLHELLADSSVFVSRFSNTIYESLALDRPVVYYNYHGEKAKNFNEEKDAFSIARNREELVFSLLYEFRQINTRERAREYLDYHVSHDPSISADQRAADGIAEYLNGSDEYMQTMLSDIKVSVIIPIYNVEKYIERCLLSVVSQTMKEIEIICVDDASPDNSYKIVEEIQKNDSRVKLFRLEKNVGLSGARNYGMTKATGNALLFVDSDDWIDTRLCEEVYNEMISTESDVTIFNYMNCFPDEMYPQKARWFHEVDTPSFRREKLLYLCAVWYKMYKRSFIQSNDITFPEGLYCEDWYWTIQWATKVDRVSFTNKPYYFYVREREGSIMQSVDRVKILNSLIHNVNLCIKYIRNNGYDMKFVYPLINKMDKQTIYKVTGDEKKELTRILSKYLNDLFEAELPKDIYSRTIKNIYSKGKKASSRREMKQPSSGGEMKKSTIRGVIKRILLKTSYSYRAISRIEQNQNRLIKKSDVQIKKQNAAISRLKTQEKKLCEQEKRVDAIENQLSDGFTLLLNELNAKSEKLDAMLDKVAKKLDAESVKSQANIESLREKLDVKVDKLHYLYKEYLSNLSQLQDAAVFGGDGNGNIEISSQFLNNLEISIESDGYHTAKLYGKDFYFSDPKSFWTVYKELIVNEDYFIKADKTDPVILDCGAHIGLATLYFKHIFPNAKITAFEPDPENTNLINMNLISAGISDVEVIQKAVGEANGNAKFYRTFDMSMGGSLTTRLKDKLETQEYDVEVCRLKEFIEQRKIDFLKLDVEGIESEIIVDCKDCISNVNYIFIEFHTGDQLEMSRITKILEVLDQNGFTYQISRADSYKAQYVNRPFKNIMAYCTHLIYAKNTLWND